MILWPRLVSACPGLKPRLATALSLLALLALAGCGQSSTPAAPASAQSKASPSSSPWRSQGTIEVMDGRTWVVGQRLVTVLPTARVQGAPAVGKIVQLQGSLGADGEPAIDRVSVLPSPTPEPAVAPTAVAPLPAVSQDHQPAPRPAERGAEHGRGHGHDKGD